jgi:hypothetical protein
MCHPHVLRSLELRRHNGRNTLKSQDNRGGLGTLPRNPGECGKEGKDGGFVLSNLIDLSGAKGLAYMDILDY